MKKIGPIAQLFTCLPGGNGRQGAPEFDNKSMYFVYVIKSDKDGRLYVGMSENVARRIKEHNSGRTKSTKGYTPWKLIFQEKIENRMSARKREKYLKSGYGKKWIKQKYIKVP